MVGQHLREGEEQVLGRSLAHCGSLTFVSRDVDLEVDIKVALSLLLVEIRKRRRVAWNAVCSEWLEGIHQHDPWTDGCTEVLAVNGTKRLVFLKSETYRSAQGLKQQLGL